MPKIAIFASGKGSNALSLIDRFKQNLNITVQCIVCNKIGAPIIDHASERGIPVWIIDRNSFYETQNVLKKLVEHGVTHVVLAGFLWKVPENIIQAFSNKMVNLHPSLLPKYGGKGMYGMNVHEAIVNNNEEKTGITIHLVNEQYDKGEILFQGCYKVSPQDSPLDVAQKCGEYEKKYFSEIVEIWLNSFN
jgi:phosphoribosylglycinamide formyltransferase 1